MAVRFSATGQSYSRTLGVALSAFTVACWVKLVANRSAYTTLWSLDNGTGDFFLLQTSMAGTDMAAWDDAGLAQIVRTMTVGTWYYIAISVNAADGVTVSRAAGDNAFDVGGWSGQSSAVADAILRIGDSPYSEEWMNGTIAAVKFWNAALSQAELEAEYGQYMPVRTTNLQAWYPFLRPETVDYAGRGAALVGGSGAAREDGPPIVWNTPPAVWARAESTLRAVGESGTVLPVSAAKGGTAGLVTETSVLATPARSKRAGVAQSLESAVVLPARPSKAGALAAAAEAGTATAVTPAKGRRANQAVELGTVSPVGSEQVLRQVVETALARPAGRGKSRTASPSFEAGTARAVTSGRGRMPQQITEHGTAVPVHRAGQKMIGVVVETGSAQPVRPQPPLVGLLGQVVEAGTVGRLLRRTPPLRAGAPYVAWRAATPHTGPPLSGRLL
ncbi:LamG-like jellyroll fold domain-containing protein [Streptosporangium sp. NPDC020072]|uniref:LamG-like jellyroll fold domain-containing protein n=1 Tax=Streptosporangium sp. NPDC020072 TaxID=3154788 RepID=UPI00342DB60A